MKTAKCIIFISGLMFIILGIIGVFMPELAAQYYSLNLEQAPSKTAFRAISGMSLGVGCLLVFGLMFESIDKLLLILAILLLSFIVPRFYGLVVDGFDQAKMWGELVFELMSFILVCCVYKSINKDAN